MIKGHTRIELTNVNTGEKKVVEDNNTFMANNIAEYCRTFGVMNTSALFDSDYTTLSSIPPYKRLTGGIYLFDDEIPSGSRFAPASVNMVGNGSIDVTNSGDPSELGSFNATESSVGMNSVTLVYDYGTSQANGEIKSVCLGSAVGGYIGYGNASGTYRLSSDIPARLTDFHSSLSHAQSIQMGTWEDEAGIIRDNYVYYIKSNAFKTLSGNYSKVLQDGTFPAIYRRRVNITSVDLLSDNKSESDFEEVFIAEGDASKGNTFDGYNAYFSNFSTVRQITPINDNTFVLTTVIDSNTIAPNNTKLNFHIIKLNEDSDGNFDGTITHTIKTVTNNTEYTWKGANYQANYLAYALSESLVVVHPTTSVTGCIVDVDSGTSIGEFTASSYSTTTVNIGRFTEDRYILHTNPSQMIRIIDGNAIIESCNCKETYRILYNSNEAFLYTRNGIYPNPMYLATINNLSTPVTKTTEYTMKVIYTLTRV